MSQDREVPFAGDSQFHWPPGRRWFLGAWGLFAVACLLPAVANSESHSMPGWECLQWSGIFLWDVLKALITYDHLASDTRYYAALGVCNLVMVLSLVAAPVLPHEPRVFRALGIVASAATLGVLTWFPHDNSSVDIASLPGAYVWAASFGVLTAAFFRAASTLRKLEALPE